MHKGGQDNDKKTKQSSKCVKLNLQTFDFFQYINTCLFYRNLTERKQANSTKLIYYLSRSDK